MQTPSRRQPTGLQAQAEEQANQEHSRRIAELKELAPLLAKLDELTPALKERGLEVHASNIHLRRESLTGDFSFHAKQHKVLRLDTAGICARQTMPAKWLAALTELGFSVVQADKPATLYPQATLRRGHLLLRVDLTVADAERLAAASAAQAPAQVAEAA